MSGVWCLLSGVWCLVSGVWWLMTGVSRRHRHKYRWTSRLYDWIGPVGRFSEKDNLYLNRVCCFEDCCWFLQLNNCFCFYCLDFLVSVAYSVWQLTVDVFHDYFFYIQLINGFNRLCWLELANANIGWQRGGGGLTNADICWQRGAESGPPFLLI